MIEIPEDEYYENYYYEEELPYCEDDDDYNNLMQDWVDTEADWWEEHGVEL